MNKKCGFIAVVGEPNAGKSTIVNSIVGQKISIVSSKVQTTRRQIKGIKILENSQLVFIDTPGFFKARTSLESAIIKNFRSSYKDSDIIMLVIDSSSRHIANTLSFLANIKNSKSKIIVLLNKIDKVIKGKLLNIALEIQNFDFVNKIFMISAIKNNDLNQNQLQLYA